MVASKELDRERNMGNYGQKEDGESEKLVEG